eukprot:6174086-Pleurochrysis_carterae.AAC.3
MVRVVRAQRCLCAFADLERVSNQNDFKRHAVAKLAFGNRYGRHITYNLARTTTQLAAQKC